MRIIFEYLTYDSPFFLQYSSKAMAFTPCIFDWKPGQNKTPGFSPLVTRYASLFPFPSGRKRVSDEEQSLLGEACEDEKQDRLEKTDKSLQDANRKFDMEVAMLTA